MNTRLGIIFFCTGLLFFKSFSLRAQETTATKDTTLSFWVNGECDMCKERIEKAVRRKGVYLASWDATTKMIKVKFDPDRISVLKLHQWIADAGHDTELKRAREVAYESLPPCCRYRKTGGEVLVHPPNVTQPLDSFEKKPAVVTAQPLISGDFIRGIVLHVDRKGNFEPLEGATIRWMSAPTTVLTDSQGIFKIPVLGNHRKLEISFTGFQTDTLYVVDQQDLKIILTPAHQLKAVQVTARQRSLLVPTASIVRTQVMTEKELFKAACCNLSESFETNPSVDVSFSDALTGSKQIQLLGLSGNYSMLTLENRPGPRGLATPMGLNYVPGPWVESIQISKGVGSVVNGFESITGQINVELKKPDKGNPVFANIYVNDMGKMDINLDTRRAISKNWSSAVLFHTNYLQNTSVDFNKDGFRDVPTGNLLTMMNRWMYQDQKGLIVQFGLTYLSDDKVGGTTAFRPRVHKATTEQYGFGINTRRWEGFLKMGYIFPGKKYKSIGWQLSSFSHDQQSYFGLNAYTANQKNIYANLIYQSIISTTAHKFRTGISFVSDAYDEQYQLSRFSRTETVPGAFFEYTYSYLDKFSMVAGLRFDANNLFGVFLTPRWHLRYEPVKGSVFRLAAGRGQRTANLLAENMGVMTSSRKFIFPLIAGKAYGLDPEVAWNTGITFDQSFYLGNRNGQVSVDYFYTNFKNQVVTDLENPRALEFYNLQGKSYSSSLQVEASYELFRKMELRLAWRRYDVKTTFGGTLLQKPLVARDRAFANLAWEMGKWKWDITASRIGTKRIPGTLSNPPLFQVAERSPAYWVMNAQVTRSFGKLKNWEVYLGGENLTNYFQQNLIVAAEQPFSPYFDASLVWGPVFGRMLYGGMRWRLTE